MCGQGKWTSTLVLSANVDTGYGTEAEVPSSIPLGFGGCRVIMVGIPTLCDTGLPSSSCTYQALYWDIKGTNPRPLFALGCGAGSGGIVSSELEMMSEYCYGHRTTYVSIGRAA